MEENAELFIAYALDYHQAALPIAMSGSMPGVARRVLWLNFWAGASWLMVAHRNALDELSAHVMQAYCSNETIVLWARHVFVAMLTSPSLESEAAQSYFVNHFLTTGNGVCVKALVVAFRSLMEDPAEPTASRLFVLREVARSIEDLVVAKNADAAKIFVSEGLLSVFESWAKRWSLDKESHRYLRPITGLMTHLVMAESGMEVASGAAD